MNHMRYRDFIIHLGSTATEDDGIRIVEKRKTADACDVWLSLVPGQDGGIAIVTMARNGTPPAGGITVKLDPATTRSALGAALSTDSMMTLARSVLTPGQSNTRTVVDFVEGLKDLQTNPFGDDEDAAVRPPPATKPPSLDACLWKQIPHGQRQDFIKKMAMGVRRGIHPDDVASELLGK
ncbi:hypothetical protein [Rhizobium leguminosarum]|uniref:hypothetical protein n=1 Tax=Rhizobium leguminosarum TaxID=384 RepID=UPI003F99B8A9